MNNSSSINIVFIDDEAPILEALKWSMKGRPKTSVFFQSPDQALSYIRENKVHIVVSDYNMPAMTGLELFQELRRDYPGIVRIMLTGQTDINEILNAINDGKVFRYIMKPVIPQKDLYPALQEAEEHVRLIERNQELVSELKQKNEELERKVRERTKDLYKAKKHAETFLQLRTNFIQNLSHEVRTPLSSLVTGIESLDLKEKSEINDCIIPMIKKSSKRLVEFFDNVLALTMLKSNSLKLTSDQIRIRDVYEELSAQVENHINKDQVYLESEYKAQVEAPLLANKEYLSRMLWNVLDNAVKFTREGHICFKVWIQKADNKRHRLEFYIGSTSDAIPEDKADLIFQQFVQLDSSITRTSSGAGIGLSISNYIAQLYGGEITYTYKKDCGNVFCISLNLEKAG